MAQSWSNTMAAQNRLYHDPNWTSRAPSGWKALAENVAYHASWKPSSEKVASSLFNAWLGSSQHRSNLLSSTYTYSGLGVAVSSTGVFYATQDFARF